MQYVTPRNGSCVAGTCTPDEDRTSFAVVAPPAVSPSVPGGCRSAPTAVLPRRSGRAKVLTPSPPKFAPSRENNSPFPSTARNCPLAGANPAGQKSNGNVQSCPTKAGDDH